MGDGGENESTEIIISMAEADLRLFYVRSFFTGIEPVQNDPRPPKENRHKCDDSLLSICPKGVPEQANRRKF